MCCQKEEVTHSLGLALGIDELLTEDIPITLLASLLNYDLLVVICEFEDDELDLFAELELVEFGDAVVCDRNPVLFVGDVSCLYPRTCMICEYLVLSFRGSRTREL